MSLSTPDSVFLEDLETLTQGEPRGRKSSLASLLRSTRDRELAYALASNDRQITIKDSPALTKTRMLDFITDDVLTHTERRAVMDASLAAFDVIRGGHGQFLLELFITCCLYENLEALVELSNFMTLEFIMLDGNAFPKMYAYIESGETIPFDWWVSLNFGTGD